MTRPIRLKTHRVLIKAPRELVYQKMSSIGQGRLKGDSSESSRVISRDGNNIVAEFRTRSGLFTYTTIEQVTLEPPGRITFVHLKSPLQYAQEEFLFNDVDSGTEMVHSGEFTWHRFPLIGWLVGRLYVKPMFERVLQKHMHQIKIACEARAARSHVFPRRQGAGPSKGPAKRG